MGSFKLKQWHQNQDFLNYYEKHMAPAHQLMIGNIIQSSVINHAPSNVLKSLLYFPYGNIDYQSLKNTAYSCVGGKSWNKLLVVIDFLKRVGRLPMLGDSHEMLNRTTAERIFKKLVVSPIPVRIAAKINKILESYTTPKKISTFWLAVDKMIKD